MPQVLEIPEYAETWTLDKQAGTATLLTSGYTRPVEYTYDQATRMIRLARILGATPQKPQP